MSAVRHRLWIIVSAIIITVAVATSGLADRAIFLSGYVYWSSGEPAQGVEVQLTANGTVESSTFVDAVGYFAFFDVLGEPREYTIQILAAGGVVTKLPPQDIPAGGTMSRVVLH